MARTNFEFICITPTHFKYVLQLNSFYVRLIKRLVYGLERFIIQCWKVVEIKAVSTTSSTIFCSLYYKKNAVYSVILGLKKKQNNCISHNHFTRRTTLFCYYVTRKPDGALTLVEIRRRSAGTVECVCTASCFIYFLAW